MDKIVPPVQENYLVAGTATAESLTLSHVVSELGIFGAYVV